MFGLCIYVLGCELIVYNTMNFDFDTLFHFAKEKGRTKKEKTNWLGE